MPQLDPAPQLSRAELRLAAEAALLQLAGRQVPAKIWARAFGILNSIATGE